MSNSIKKNLIVTLDNLLNDSSINNNDQIGGRRYSQKEVDTMLMSALANIMSLYQRSIAEKQQIKDQINQIMAQKMMFSNQIGGSKHYSKTEVDSMMTSSLQTVLSLYVQSENEKHVLVEQLKQLQSGSGVPVVNNKGVVKLVPVGAVGATIPTFTKHSVKAIQTYINELHTDNKYLNLLVVKDLSKITLNGKGTLTSARTIGDEIVLNYFGVNQDTFDNIFKVLFDNTDNNGNNISTKYTDEISAFIINIGLLKEVDVFGLKANAKKIFDNKIEFDSNKLEDEIMLDTNSNFIKSFYYKDGSGAEHYEIYPKTTDKIDATELAKPDVEIALNLIRQHLKENVAPDLP